MRISPHLHGTRATTGLGVLSLTTVVALTSFGPADAAPAGQAARIAPNATAGILTATSALNDHNVWSVGYAQGGDSTITPLTQHWDGTGWSVAPAPVPAGRSHGQLQGVVTLSSKLAWAVGSTTSDADGSSRTLAERWNGKKWKVVPTAEPDAVSSSYLQSVTAVSENDVWAVGYYYGGNDGDGGTVIEHWDGTSWSLVPNADPADAFHASLQGVSAQSRKDVWASGFYYDPAGAGTTLIEHWNGKKWKHVDSPNSPNSPDTEFHAISAVSANDVWATGFTTLTGSTFLPLAEHWNGKKWAIVDIAPPTGSQNTYLYAVDGLNAKDVWATGYYYSGGSYLTLAEHWNGRKWKVSPTPNTPGALSNYLFGVSMVSSDDVWSAGGSFLSADIPFMQSWDGASWNLVPVG